MGVPPQLYFINYGKTFRLSQGKLFWQKGVVFAGGYLAMGWLRYP
ncbi:protein of unknown function [Limnospira indica PCC 8005]|uniref:Uncharacterized protein n=1 Tax=Limnospira indica PCC 8005 TaxID=376219 RepID=A0A9P1P1U4_9CYAN|nr:protein of unknown function [Limnospira indica PCC 8005]